MDALKVQRLNERMKVQMNLSWKREIAKLDQFGLEDGQAILEIGSGPGYISEQLLSRFPNSKITAVEIDPDFAEFSKEYMAEKAPGRFEVIREDIMKANLPDASFDVAVARLVFQHLNDPVGTAKEIFRMLKPGGRLIITDVDDAVWGLVDPIVPELLYVLEQHTAEQKSEGGNRFIGRELWRILKAAGFDGLDLESIVVHSDEVGLDKFVPQLDLDEMRTMVTNGFITEEDVQRVSAAFDQFKNADYPYVMMLLFMICGVKNPANC